MSNQLDGLGGPYVCAAFLCEKVLREPDGVHSAIRIVDRFMVAGSTKEMATTTIQANLLVILKSGFFKGKAHLTMTIERPDGTETAGPSIPMLLEGDDRGVAVHTDFRFATGVEGLYWIACSIEEQLLTKIPFRILYQQVQTTEARSGTDRS